MDIQEYNSEHIIKAVILTDEHILNLKNAYNCIWDYVSEHRNCEALELFTIQDIIDQWERQL